MHLVDRANNCLPLLLSEPALREGTEIAFVAHSFGGLITEQMIRVAETRAVAEENVANFLHRVRKVAFVGTPHLGADLATWGGRLRLVSRASGGLARNNPELRGLNQWFRRFAADNHLDVLTLTENQGTRLLALSFWIVKPDSADPGLPSYPIPIDADHFSIVEPIDRSSEVYRHVRDFLAQATSSVHPQRALVDAVSAQSEKIEGLKAESAAGIRRLEERLTENALTQAGNIKIPQGLVDGEVRRRLGVIQRSRFFIGTAFVDDARRLAADLVSGELQAASAAIKSTALAWCARLLMSQSDRAEALAALEAARRIGDGQEIAIADAFRLSYEGDYAQALSKLSALTTKEARTASVIVAIHSRSRDEALKWIETTAIAIADLDADGKFFVLNLQLDAGRWSAALETAKQLTDSDFDRMPPLLFVAAGAYLVQAVPDELRSESLAAVPFEAAQFPLSSDEQSLAARRRARELYERASLKAERLGSMRAAHESADRALWLSLRDVDQRADALSKLEASMRDSRHSLRRLSLALQYRLKLDLQAVEREIDRQSALTGGQSADVALARFALALTKGPKEGAEYIDKHRQILVKNLNPIIISNAEIQMLAHSGQIALAEERLRNLPDRSNHQLISRLERVIAETKGTDPIEARELEFRKSDSLSDLANLIDLLEAKRDWPKLVKYGRTYFDRTGDLSGCRLLARALYEEGMYSDVVSLLEQNQTLLGQSDNLLSLFAWSLYWCGNLKAASDALNKLRSKKDDANYRSLLFQIAIASGNWNSLLSFVESEWEERAHRSAEELLRAGQLARHLGSSRSKQLIQDAAIKGAADPNILLGCYGTAVSAGWEDSAEVQSWLQRAAQLSGEDGPVQQVSIKEMIDGQPDWQRREEQTWQKLRQGEIPMFGAAHLLNRTLTDLFLLPALSNPQQVDPRKRGALFAYSGVRQGVQVTAKRLAFDPSALLTLGMLGQLDRTIGLYDQIVIPHGTLGWLFEQQQRIQFHQPSQISDALEIKRLIDSGDLVKFSSTATVNSELVDEVGEDLAWLLSDAKADFGTDKRQRLVVRSAPVHRIGSLMEEEADLSAYADSICSCLELIDALYRQSQLTQAELQRARAYLSLQEKQWPKKNEIQDGAVLYLDQVAVSYLQHLKLLPKLHAAGFTAIVPSSETTQGDLYIRYENLSTRAVDVLESIRKALADGLENGKVRLARAVPDVGEETPHERLRNHPSFAIIGIAAEADAVVVDDRHWNQHRQIVGGFDPRPVLTTFDLINASGLSASELSETTTALRRSAFCYVPVAIDELSRMLATTTIVDGRLLETAELKALRENLLIVRMSNSLQMPKEAAWLDNVLKVALEVVRLEWRPNADFAIAGARSAWVVEHLLNVRKWANRVNPSPNVLISEARYQGVVLSLAILLSGAAPQVQNEYWKWLEDNLLARIRDEDRDLYATVIAQVGRHLAEAVRRKDGHG